MFHSVKYVLSEISEISLAATQLLCWASCFNSDKLVMYKTPMENIHYKKYATPGIELLNLWSLAMFLNHCATEAHRSAAYNRLGYQRKRPAQANVWVFYKTFTWFCRKTFYKTKVHFGHLCGENVLSFSTVNCGPNGRFEKTLGSYSEELAHSNWTILLWYMSHNM